MIRIYSGGGAESGMEIEVSLAPGPRPLNTEYMHIFSLHRKRHGHGVRRVVVVRGGGYTFL